MDYLPILQGMLSIFVLVLTAFCSVLWFLFLSVRADARKALDQLAAYKLHVAETYVTQDSLTKAIDGLNQAIGRLIDTVRGDGEATRSALSEIHRRIDGKADK